MQNNERPVSEERLRRQSPALIQVLEKGATLYDEASTAEYFGTRKTAGQLAAKLAWQFADGFAQSHEDGFTSLIDTAAGVIERIHGGVGKDEEVSIPTHSRQYVFDYAAKIVQVDR